MDVLRITPPGHSVSLCLHIINPRPTEHSSARSGRRRGYPRRPPTPPYVRFRIRRFIKDTGSAAGNPATRPTPNDQRRPSGTPRSCARPRRSTKPPDRFRPIHTHAIPQGHAASDAEPGYAVASTVSIEDSVIADVSTHPAS